MTNGVDGSSEERVIARLRQKGDALLQKGDRESALTSYEAALQAADAVVLGLSGSSAEMLREDSVQEVSVHDAARLAELFGVRGGLLRRMERIPDALKSYQVGAAIERTNRLTTTYNRANAIKLGLLSGALDLTEAQPDLVELRNALEEKLRTDERAADDAWLWADLADCRLLLGEVDEAQRAYRVFAQKAETRSPATTLSVLRELAAALAQRRDARAPALGRALLEVEVALGAT